jgi:hypothetical protein
MSGVAFDASSGATAADNTVSFSWTHTPVGDPAAVVVYVMNRAATFPYASVFYGALELVAVPGGSAVDTGGENGSCRAYFAGSGIPTGAQTVAVNESAGMTFCWAAAFTLTADGDCEITDVVLRQEDQALVSVLVDDGSPGTASLRLGGLHSGLPSIPAAGASSTREASADVGSHTYSTVRETTPGQGSRTVGWVDVTSDDCAAVYLAVSEIPSENAPGGGAPLRLGFPDNAIELYG